MTSAAPPSRIAVKGSIHIGRRLKLVQRSAQAEPGPRFRSDRPNDGVIPDVDYTYGSAPAGELALDRLDFALDEGDSDIFIRDDGLCASYGIFGAPGSGKTYLLMHLLRQLLALNGDRKARKYGALILDPKAALIEEVKQIVAEAGRSDDLAVINTDELKAPAAGINVIDCALEPYELARSLVLVARSAGIAASEPYWFIEWANLFGAAIYLLKLLDPFSSPVTLRQLLDAVLLVEEGTGLVDRAPQRRIQQLAREGRQQLSTRPRSVQQDAVLAINQIDRFYRQDYVATIEGFIGQAFSDFQQSRFECFSAAAVLAGDSTFYDRIIEDGKIVLVSASPADPGMAKTLCTLVKCLFQQTVLSRMERVRAGALRNFERPLLLACDEFSQVASEVPGQPMGDGNFFSLSRQQGCMGLLATQSVNVLQATDLKENWRSVFSNFGAKIFLRLVDNETTEEATKLAGESDWYVSSQGTSRSKDGLGTSIQRDLRERKSLPSKVLTQVFRTGEGVVIGSLDAGKTRPSVDFVKVGGNPKRRPGPGHE